MSAHQTVKKKKSPPITPTPTNYHPPIDTSHRAPIVSAKFDGPTMFRSQDIRERTDRQTEKRNVATRETLGLC